MAGKHITDQDGTLRVKLPERYRIVSHDRWCFPCRALRRFGRMTEGTWRCADCWHKASVGVARELDAVDPPTQ